MARLGNLKNITAALKQPNFAWYISGGSIALFGIWAQRLTIGWLTWELTQSGFWLGMMAFADLFPTVLLTPIAGVVADRVDRRIMSIVTQSLGMLQAFTLAGLTFLGLIDEWLLLLLTFFIGVVWAFNTAARLTMVPNLIEAEHVSSAIALDSVVFNIARFIGPAIAGYLYDAVGPEMSFLLNGLTFSIFVFTLYKCRMVRDERRGISKSGVFAQAVEGIRYAARHPGIGPILIVVTALALGVKPILELLPGVTGAVYKLSATELGWMMSVAAVGAILGSFWLAQRGTPVGLTRVVIGTLLVGALSIFAFTAVRDGAGWGVFYRHRRGAGRHRDADSDAKCGRRRHAWPRDEPLWPDLPGRPGAGRPGHGVRRRVHRISGVACRRRNRLHRRSDLGVWKAPRGDTGPGRQSIR